MLPTTLSRLLRSRLRLAILVVLASAGACKSQSSKPSEPASAKGTIDARVATSSEVLASGPADGPCSLPSRSYRHQAPGRLIAIGDIHGDLQAARRALRLGGAIDESDHWIGGNLRVVQTGDILDRGDDEQEILDLFAALDTEARAAGGAIHRLNGNHELMNAMGDFRYVTRGGFDDFVEGETPGPPVEARKRAFFPGGPYARKLAEHDLVGVVGDSVFVHGGVLPRFVEGLEQSNRASRCYLLGESTEPPEAVVDPEGPLWTRVFSSAEPACDLLQETLDKLGVARMIVGHTPQLSGITSACDGKVWRVDTGMAAFYGGPTQVLEIEGGKVRVLE